MDRDVGFWLLHGRPFGTGPHALPCGKPVLDECTEGSGELDEPSGHRCWVASTLLGKEGTEPAALGLPPEAPVMCGSKSSVGQGWEAFLVTLPTQHTAPVRTNCHHRESVPHSCLPKTLTYFLLCRHGS